MKIKVLSLVVAATAAFTATSSAVSLNLAGIANTSAGTINVSGNLATGTAIFVSSTEALTTISASLNPLLQSTTSTLAQFNSALTALLGTTSATDPGVVRTVAFTNGLLSTSAASELGNVGNNTYLFLVAENSGFITGIGAYSGSAVPAAGAVTFNAGFANDTPGVGTSVLVGTNGFQLAPVVPEPSAALLGAIGALGLLRRRRN